MFYFLIAFSRARIKAFLRIERYVDVRIYHRMRLTYEFRPQNTQRVTRKL